LAEGKAAVIGGISGAISFGIGESVTGMSNFVAKAGLQAGMHGIKSGIMTSIEGGSFMSGFAAGAVSSLISSSVEIVGHSGGYYLDDDYTQWTSFGARNPNLLKAMMISSGGLSGGISSSIAGGNFWSGAREGLITSGLNHAMHDFVKKHLEKPIVDKILSDLNLNPEDQPEAHINSIKKILEHKKVKSEYIRAGSPDLKNDIEVFEGHKFGTYADIDFDTGKIRIFGASFKNWRILTLKTVHEFRHRFHLVSGNYDKWIDITGHYKSALAISEYFVRKFEFSWSGEFYPGMYSEPKREAELWATKKFKWPE